MSDTNSSGQVARESCGEKTPDAKVEPNDQRRKEPILPKYRRDRSEHLVSDVVVDTGLDNGCECQCGVHLLTGAAVGVLAGYLDSHFIEPFGLVMGGSLLALQVLDMKFKWSGRKQNGLLEKLGWVGTGFLAGFSFTQGVIEVKEKISVL